MMTLIFNRRTLVWFLLIGVTILSWGIGEGIGFSDVRYASGAIILLAMVKIRYVMLEFMELRNAPVPVRLVAEGWVFAVCLILLILYLNGVSTWSTL